MARKLKRKGMAVNSYKILINYKNTLDIYIYMVHYTCKVMKDTLLERSLYMIRKKKGFTSMLST